MGGPGSGRKPSGRAVDKKHGIASLGKKLGLTKLKSTKVVRSNSARISVKYRKSK